MKPYYEKDGITIYHGDCREVLPTLGPVDLVLTDPPYGTGQHAHRDPRSRTKLAITRDYGSWAWDKLVDSELMRQVLSSSMKHHVIWGGNHYAHMLPPVTHWLVWDKDNQGTPFGDCELAWSSIPGAIRILRWRWNGMIQEPGHPKEERLHPTQKPVPVMSWCIQQAGSNVDIILDPFMGSGTTLRAAKDLGRKAIGIEIEEKYCEIAANRMAQEVLAI